MKFQITKIEFDFTGELEDCGSYSKGITERALNMVWEVDEEGELADAVSDYFGWCILSIDYQEV